GQVPSAVGGGRGARGRRDRRPREGHLGGGLAQAPDAGLSPDGAGAHRRDPGEHRGGALERQDGLRPPGGAAAAGLADDRPLRRAAGQPDDRRLRAGPRLPARRQRAGRGAAAGDPDPADRRGAGGVNRAAEIVTGETGEVLKRRLRTGTVVTTDDRNWELRYSS